MNVQSHHSCTELPYFFEVSGSARFAVFHAGAHPVRGAFLFCHPLFEEKLWTHRAYVSFARRLASLGFSVLRMDLRGTGDSDEMFGAAEVSDYLEDLAAGWDELTRRCGAPKIRALFGLRLGGTLALALSERLREAHCLILWEPVIDTMQYFQELLRSNLTAQVASHGKVIHTRDKLIGSLREGRSIDVDGYPMTPKLYESLTKLNLTDFANALVSKGLILQVCRSSDQSLRENYLNWCSAHPTFEIRSAVEEPFWREIKTFYGSAEILESKSIEWLMPVQ